MNSLEKVEPFLSVRHYYALAVLRKEIPGDDLREVLGKDPKRVLRGAKKALARVAAGGCPQLRPPGVWKDCLSKKAGITTTFGRAMTDHGLEKGDLSLLREPHLIQYARGRLQGLTQPNACILAGYPQRISLDDEVIHLVQTRKFGAFKPSRVVVKKWTRGAMKSYRKLISRCTTQVRNKSLLSREAVIERAREPVGGSFLKTVTDMAVLSYRIMRLFARSVSRREILEFSEQSQEEFEQTMPMIALDDWRVVRMGKETFVRCYWKCPAVKHVKTSRTQEADGFITSSFDIPACEV